MKYANEGNAVNQINLFGFAAPSGEPRPQSGREEKLRLDDLMEIYEKNWIDEWYPDKKNKEEYYKKGKQILKDFYAQFEKNPPKILKINPSTPFDTAQGMSSGQGTLALELPFNLKIGDYILFGVIDRIDELKDGVEIIDYKTGQLKDKLDFENKEQLLIYQIAAQEVLKIKPKELSYYYLDDNKKTSFLGTEKEITTQKEKIIEEIEKIKNSEFNATPGWQCQYCDFRDICDYAQR